MHTKSLSQVLSEVVLVLVHLCVVLKDDVFPKVYPDHLLSPGLSSLNELRVVSLIAVVTAPSLIDYSLPSYSNE